MKMSVLIIFSVKRHITRTPTHWFDCQILCVYTRWWFCKRKVLQKLNEKKKLYKYKSRYVFESQWTFQYGFRISQRTSIYLHTFFGWVWEKYGQNQFVLLGFGIDSNFKWEMFFYYKVCMYNGNWGEIILYVYMLLLTKSCVMLMRKKIPRMSAFS